MKYLPLFLLLLGTINATRFFIIGEDHYTETATFAQKLFLKLNQEGVVRYIRECTPDVKECMTNGFLLEDPHLRLYIELHLFKSHFWVPETPDQNKYIRPELQDFSDLDTEVWKDDFEKMFMNYYDHFSSDMKMKIDDIFVRKLGDGVIKNMGSDEIYNLFENEIKPLLKSYVIEILEKELGVQCSGEEDIFYGKFRNHVWIHRLYSYFDVKESDTIVIQIGRNHVSDFTLLLKNQFPESFIKTFDLYTLTQEIMDVDTFYEYFLKTLEKNEKVSESLILEYFFNQEYLEKKLQKREEQLRKVNLKRNILSEENIQSKLKRLARIHEEEITAKQKKLLQFKMTEFLDFVSEILN